MICEECGYDTRYISEGCDRCYADSMSSPVSISHGDAGHGPELPKGQEIRLLWTDPPFGTGKVMRGPYSRYKDHSDNGYVVEAIKAWLPFMAGDGTVVVCCDYRLASEMVAGMRDSGWTYRGEVIWEFGLGRPRTDWWPVRHNNILTFDKNGQGLFDPSAVPLTKRLAPKKGYPDTKPAGSVWDFTMSNTHPDRNGYPNQKPLEIIEPFVLAHTLPDDLVADPFAGSGSTGVAARKHGRRAFLNDGNGDAVDLMLELEGLQ